MSNSMPSSSSFSITLKKEQLRSYLLLIFLMEVLENEFVKPKNIFLILTLKSKKKGVYRKLPFYLMK